MVVIDLWPSQRGTPEIGTPSAKGGGREGVPQVVERGVRRRQAALIAGFQRGRRRE